MRFDSLEPPQVLAYCAEHIEWAKEQFPDGELVNKKEEREQLGQLFGPDLSSNEQDDETDGEGENLAGDRRGIFGDEEDEDGEEDVEDLGDLFAEEAPERGDDDSKDDEERKGIATTSTPDQRGHAECEEELHGGPSWESVEESLPKEGQYWQGTFLQSGRDDATK